MIWQLEFHFSERFIMLSFFLHVSKIRTFSIIQSSYKYFKLISWHIFNNLILFANYESDSCQ